MLVAWKVCWKRPVWRGYSHAGVVSWFFPSSGLEDLLLGGAWKLEAGDGGPEEATLELHDRRLEGMNLDVRIRRL